MPDDVILTSLENGVATLTLNRPDRLNALSPDLITKSVETLARWEEDPSVAVVVVTGSGRAFCAGGDIGGMAQENAAPRPLEERIDWLRRAQQISWRLYNMPKITIASVNGFAMGAGLGVCLSCDLRIASDQAKFGTAYAKVGFGGDFGVTWLLTRYAGAPKAKELLLTADTFDAAEALRLGLLNRVVPAESLPSETHALASRRRPAGELSLHKGQRQPGNDSGFPHYAGARARDASALRPDRRSSRGRDGVPRETRAPLSWKMRRGR
jgi:2-(1,2-epoxy-1,2-dihydrophenyl)acetyl-CoA isomerase